MIERIIRLPLGDDQPSAHLIYGLDVREGLRRLPDATVQTVCTSPPYWGLRDYGIEPSVWGGNTKCTHEWHGGVIRRRAGGEREYGSYDNGVGRGPAPGLPSYAFCTRCDAFKGHLGLEPTPELYVEHLVAVFSEVCRVLKPNGTLWLNLGDSYWANGGTTRHGQDSANYQDKTTLSSPPTSGQCQRPVKPRKHANLRPKDLIGIPWMVAFALRNAGWFLRSDIIWAKTNPMPESVRDRPTSAHEHIFLFAHPDSKGRYLYDHEAIQEPQVSEDEMSRNRRNVWHVATRPYPGAHFAVWPQELVEPMIWDGSNKGDTVLDPFSGSGTTGKTALELGRHYIGVDANEHYLDLAEARILGLEPPVEDTNDDPGVLELFG